MTNPIRIENDKKQYEILISLRKEQQTVIIEVMQQRGYLCEKTAKQLDNTFGTLNSRFIEMGGSHYNMIVMGVDSLRWGKFIESDFIDKISDVIDAGVRA